MQSPRVTWEDARVQPGALQAWGSERDAEGATRWPTCTQFPQADALQLGDSWAALVTDQAEPPG